MPMTLKKTTQNDATLEAQLHAEIMKWPAGKSVSDAYKTTFMTEFLHGETLTDLEKTSEAEAIETVKTLWELFQKRRFEDIYIDVQEDNFGQVGRIDMTIMQRQIPFITDSILNLLRQSHISVSVMANATLKVRRDDDGVLLSVHADEDHGPDLQQDKILYLQCENRGEALNIGELRQNISNILRDVHAAVEDWLPMQGQITDVINEMEECASTINADDAYEAAQFLTFLKEGNFTFLGYREHDIRREKSHVSFNVDTNKSLGILRDQGFLLFDEIVTDEMIPEDVVAFLTASERPMMVLKANRLATVHRNVPMDTIIVKRYNKNGDVTGLRLFAGLFTAHCYALPVDQIPYLKRKLNAVLDRAGYDLNTHSWRAIKHAIESYPRDELFQISTDELYTQIVGIHRLDNRPEVDVFVRKDPLQRHFSAMVYLPKEQFNTNLRLTTQKILEDFLHGDVIDHHVMVDEKPLARLQYTLTFGGAKLPEFDIDALRTRLIEACTPWFDRLKVAALNRFSKQDTENLLRNLSDAFSVSYKDQVKIAHALDDLAPVQDVMHNSDMRINLHRYACDEEGVYRIKFYQRDAEASLSKLLPILENMGFHCLHEYSYDFIAGNDLPVVWMHELVGTIDNFQPEMLDNVRPLFAQAFEAAWRGKVDSDSFNALVVAVGLSIRQANLFRAIARYLDLANYPLGTAYMAQVLAQYADITSLISNLFEARLTPASDSKTIESETARIQAALDAKLENVEKLDEDRVLRSFINVISNILRTNYFQTDAEGQPLDVLVMKLAAEELKDLPQPRPYREMFVYSTRFEAVHLRGGPIARGGIRWSDRYEDFRTEILGLVKAQMVKNAVIVPVGAKGGFICKNQPNIKDPQERQAEGVACYQAMVRSFLSITDNLDPTGKVVPPQNTQRLDNDDPYLVVAADKGTARFSDIANAISLEHNFWLGDAFASGGSVGYDHKAMGITARGAWECIKRNFRELGKDIQTEDFTAAGVGDMSGDVFGNGMLLSKHTRLVAAFDHRHIFVDPTPDAASSFTERQRLFDMPGSSWMDYNPKLLSKGGMIFNRQDKSLTLTPEIQELLDLANERVTPTELMQAILRARVELMYFGGIGTYIKGANQSNEQVGDKANDTIRVNGGELRCQVLGEGANLAATQSGRIEFALTGGRIEPDFIANSGGVDTSDHEVNIKILFQPMVNSGKLALEDRNKLLEDMTGEVASHVLKTNYDQSLALSLQERHAVDDFSAYVDFIRQMERQGLFSRKLENLPSDEEIQSRMQRRMGLTRPELSVVTAYSKIDLFNRLINSDLPDDPEMWHQVLEYFPDVLQERYKEEILNHKLKREIVATEIANVLINRMGPLFVINEMNRTSLPAEMIARAWVVVRSIFDLRNLWQEVDKLDNVVPAAMQLSMYEEMAEVMEQGVKWFLHHHSDGISFEKLVPLYRDNLIQLQPVLAETVPQSLRDMMAEKQEELNSFESIRNDIKIRFMQLPLQLAGCDIIRIAQTSKAPVSDIAKVYFTLNDRLHLAEILSQLASLPVNSAWDQEAKEGLEDEILSMGTDMTIRFIKQGLPAAQIGEWLEKRQEALTAIDDMVQDMVHAGNADLALLTVLTQRLRRFVHKNEA